MRGATLAVLVATGCSNSVHRVALADLARALEIADCAQQAACGWSPDQATCEALYAPSPALLTTIADVAAGTVTYDPILGGACVSEHEQAGCAVPARVAVRVVPAGDIESGLFYFNDDGDPCRAMFSGTVATGSPCIEGTECTNGDVCEFPSACVDSINTCCTGSSTGTCVARAPDGAPCLGDVECSADSYCDISQTGMCAPLVTVAGASCNQIQQCASPLHCDLDLNAQPATGTCVMSAALGAACDPKDLPFAACADSRDYCDGTTNLCTRSIAVGGACTPGESNCVYYARCDATTSTCIALAGLNEPCSIDASGESNCLFTFGGLPFGRGVQLSCMRGMTACVANAAGCTCVLPPAPVACE